MATIPPEGFCPYSACKGNLVAKDGHSLRCAKCGATFVNAWAVEAARSVERTKDIEAELRAARKRLGD